MVRLAVLGSLVALAAILAAGCGGSAAVEAVSADICGPVDYQGAGNPDLLIVSDLPLRNPPAARRQVAGIKYVLHERGYRAGGYTVGYQSCDDSTARTGYFDEKRCAANTKAYAADKDVVGIIGPYNSPCAYAQIAVANAAPHGPLVMVGTATTDPELTAATPGGDVGTPGKFYPTKVRSFARLSAPDQFQAAAAAMLAKQEHLRRVFVLSDGESAGNEVALWFRRAAGRLGVAVVGSAAWNPKAKSFQALAARVAAANPDGVYLAGYAFPPLRGAVVLKAVQAALVGRDVTYVAFEGFLDEQDLDHSAEGLYATVAGIPAGAVGPQGKKLQARAGRDRPFEYGAIYGAAAAEILLDAISRSDGTRASITRNVFGAQTAGIIGRFGFDGEGDPTVGAITVLRLRGGHFVNSGVLYPPRALAKGTS